MPMISKAGDTIRALTPEIMPRFSVIVWMVWSKSMLDGLKMSGVVAKPVRQMCRKQMISVSVLGSMWRGKPPKVSQPELPASTIVVTPARTPPMLGSTPLALTPANTWVWRSMSPGVITLPLTSRTRPASSEMSGAMRAILCRP